MEGIVHYSTDTVFLWSGGEEVSVPYSDLERKLPKQLVERVDRFSITEVIALNGPGGFTALRIGSLALQTVKEFSTNAIRIYSLSKITLYSMLIEKDILPSCGVIHIGQKKKLWKVIWEPGKKTTQAPTIDMLEQTTVDSLDNTQYFIDKIDSHLLLEQLNTANMIHFSSHTEGLTVQFQDKKQLLAYQSMKQGGVVEQLQPNYMIEPTLS